jgi:hypothetical protein
MLMTRLAKKPTTIATVQHKISSLAARLRPLSLISSTSVAWGSERRRATVRRGCGQLADGEISDCCPHDKTSHDLAPGQVGVIYLKSTELGIAENPAQYEQERDVDRGKPDR